MHTSSETRAATMVSASDFLVTGLEEIQPAYGEFEGEMYAGMLPADNGERTDLNTMFWFFTNESSDSLVLWLNGGPGCSSFNCGVLMESSPVTQPLRPAGYCCLKPTPEMSANPYAWTQHTNMLYVEHPIGTGFSHSHTTPPPETEAVANTDLDAFLVNFLKTFPGMQDKNFFIMGESYAGMFVPTLAKTILHANKHRELQIPLRGAAIGNGWIDARIQGPATIDYSWWHGLIDEPTRNALHREFKQCIAKFDADEIGTEKPPFHPFNVQDDCGIMWGILQAGGDFNAYDVSTFDPNVDQVTFSSEAFYNNDAVKQALHAPDGITWHGCQGFGRRRLLEAHRQLYMDNDRPFSVVPDIGKLLDEGLPIIVYNGDRDMTTNMVGTEKALKTMKWEYADQWDDAPRGLWKVNDYPAGWAKSMGNLTFITVYNSGHMVPYNVPTSAYDLMTRLTEGKSFLDQELPQIRVKKEHNEMPTMGAPMPAASQFRSGYTEQEMLLAALVSAALGALVAWISSRRTSGRYQSIPDVD